MGIKSYIHDPQNNRSSEVGIKDGINSLNVLTNPLKTYINQSVFFTNSKTSNSLNQNFTTLLSTEHVHNGNDDNYWEGTTIVGSSNAFIFSSSSRSNTGSKSIEVTNNANDNDMFQLSNNEIIDDDKYGRLVGWVYIKQDWSSDDIVDIFFYNTNTGETCSDEVNLTNYINQNNIEEWQRFNISSNDFGISSDYDALRWRIRSSSSTPVFYLDDIDLEEIEDVGSLFTIKPQIGTWWNITGLGITIASSYDSTLTDGTLPNIPYNGLLGTSLNNGLNYRRQENGENLFSFVMYDLLDILNQYSSRITSQGYDGNITWIKIDIDIDPPYLLKSEYEDFISITVNDDLSELEYFKIVASIKEEKRNSTGLIYRGPGNDKI